MTSNNYRVKIGRGDTQFEAEGDKAFVLSMLKRFGALGLADGLEEKLKSSVSHSSAETGIHSLAHKPQAVGEFIRQSGYTRHTDLVLAFAYYLEKQKGLKDFTPADLNKCYYDAKLENSNTSQMIAQGIRNGTLMNAKGDGAKGKKRYTLTKTGIERIEAHLSKKLK